MRSGPTKQTTEGRFPVNMRGRRKRIEITGLPTRNNSHISHRVGRQSRARHVPLPNQVGSEHSARGKAVAGVDADQVPAVLWIGWIAKVKDIKDR